MILKSKFKKLLVSYLEKNGYDLIPSRFLYKFQKNIITNPSFRNSLLPAGAKEYLLPKNPRLKELQEEYATIHQSSHILWTEEHVSEEDLLYFRGDNAYVWQLRGTNMNILGYALTTYYIKSIDKFNLLEKLAEDEYFGNYIFNIDGKLISRDLLDSINEIYFLEKHLQLSIKKDFKILDIGAGYGRLAHRMVNTYENLSKYYCADAIPTSSFIAEYYINFREIGTAASILQLNNVENVLSKEHIDIAINIHSFSECSIEDVEWWISRVAENQIKYLLIVPNVYVNSSNLLVSHDRKNISEILEKYGYSLLVTEPKFNDPVVQEYGINPTSYFLFELK